MAIRKRTVKIVASAGNIARRAGGKVKRRVQNFFDLSQCLEDVRDAFSRDSRSRILFVLILVAGVVVYANRDKDGWLWTWAANHSTHYIVAWILKNPERFLGLVAFVPTLFGMRGATQIPMAIICIGGVIVLPTIPVVEYSIISGLLHLFFTVRRPQTQWIIVIVGAVLWWTGHVAATAGADELKNAIAGKHFAHTHPTPPVSKPGGSTRG